MKIEKAYVIGLGLIFILVLAGCGSSKNETPVKREVVSGVTVMKINPATG